MPRAKKAETDKEKSMPKLVCIRCGCQRQQDFYSSKDSGHKFFSKIPYCKSCVLDIYKEYLKKYKGDMNLAVYYMCRKIDIPYIHTAYTGAVENINNENAKITGEDAIVSAYIKGLSFAEKNGWGSSFDDSQGEGQIDSLTSFDVYTKVKKNKKVRGTLDESEYENIEYSTEYLQGVWGNYDNEDLAYLQSEYLDWQTKLGGQIDEKSIDVTVKQICYTSLDIMKDRQNGSDVTKKTASLISLMNTAGLVEKQSKVTSTTLSVGQRIEDIEKMRPIKTVDPDLSDVDNLRPLFDAYVGCTSRALGKKNKFTEKFEEEFAPYTIDIIGGHVDDSEVEEVNNG